MHRVHPARGLNRRSSWTAILATPVPQAESQPWEGPIDSCWKRTRIVLSVSVFSKVVGRPGPALPGYPFVDARREAPYFNLKPE